MKINMILAAGVVLAGASAATGELVGNPLVVTATNALGTGSFTVRLSDGTFDPNTGDFTYNWGGGSRTITDTEGRVIATLNGLSFGVIGDPQVSLGFALTAGNLPTNFTLSSALNVFAPIANPTVSGVASMTVTDINGDGATITGGFGGWAYSAFYNGAAVYGLRVPDFGAGPTLTNNATGFLAGSIGGAVTNQSATYSFTLSANDSASGTSVYTIVPAPGALVLAGAGLLMGRRRR